MKKALKVLIAISTTVMILVCSSVSAFAEPAVKRPTLKFNSDGKFKIMMMNDTQDTDRTAKDTVKLIENSLDKEKPDLVVFVGDNIAGFWLGVNEQKVKKAIDNIVAPVNNRNIPFAIVFGNHDQQCGISKEKQMEMYMSYQNCLAVDEGSEVSNCGTYNLLIKDSKNEKNIFNIWMIDSGTGALFGGYDGVNPDQVAWFEKTSEKLKSENGGKALPSLLFQHVPVLEMYDLFTVVPKGTENSIHGYRTKSNNYYILNPKAATGKLLEAPCTPDKNSGEFTAWVKQGGILGAYFGHDHVNDLKGTLNGIDLGYTPGAGFHMYGNGVYRGVRTFELDESNLQNYKTEVRYYKDLVSAKAETTINDSDLNNKLRVYIPLALAACIILMLLLLGIIPVVKRIRRKRKNKKAA